MTQADSEPERLPFVERNRSRHGKDRYYFRRQQLRVRLPDPGEDPALFRKLYDRCLIDSGGLTPKIPSKGGRGRKRRHNPIYRAIWLAKSRAKEKGRSFDLTSGWMLEQLARQDNRCAITGIEMAVAADLGAKSPYQVSIDRIDSARGYTRDNCRLVALAVNLALNVWGLETYLALAKGAIETQNCHTKSVAFGSEPPHQPFYSTNSDS